MNEKKIPIQKLFLSQSIKSQAHVLTFYAFALQMIVYARYRAYCEHPHWQNTLLQLEAALGQLF
ncbi:hypothetical protein [Agathobaculum desmolans]|uniref:hypothetical protein n=1 Tax=Agathobaculum desmolans TaxID=39484 RepID=UPI0012B6252B|nr:hypothetical protein [Agathobaculum desmolans]